MTITPNQTMEVSHTVARLKAAVLAMIFGLLGGGGMFIVTAWLLIRGGPRVGLHLNLLSNYFIGYTVSWPGCFIGFFYGAIVGALVGWCIGMVYNRIVGLRAR